MIFWFSKITNILIKLKYEIDRRNTLVDWIPILSRLFWPLEPNIYNKLKLSISQDCGWVKVWKFAIQSCVGYLTSCSLFSAYRYLSFWLLEEWNLTLFQAHLHNKENHYHHHHERQLHLTVILQVDPHPMKIFMNRNVVI